MRPDPQEILAVLIVIFFGIGLHEYAHCKLADAAGDPTPRYYGRVTLNLFKHFDPMGAIMILVTVFYGYGIGWGKPAPMDPKKMRNPHWDFFAAVAAGPICNFLQATVYALVMRLMFMTGNAGALVTSISQDGFINYSFLGILLFMGVIVNLRLMLFNLIPLGPLDGHWLVGQFLPEPARYHWHKWNVTTGTYILFGIIFLGQLSGYRVLNLVLGPPSEFLFKFLTGM